MSAASYNRGSRAISDHITQGLRARVADIPSLPVGWSIAQRTNFVHVWNEQNQLVHREPVPYRGTVDLERVARRATDPCLRGICNLNSHALNGWQLHYA